MQRRTAVSARLSDVGQVLKRVASETLFLQVRVDRQLFAADLRSAARNDECGQAAQADSKNCDGQPKLRPSPSD